MKRNEGEAPFIVGMKCEGDVNRSQRGGLCKIGELGDSLGHLAGYGDERGMEYLGEDILEENK